MNNIQNRGFLYVFIVSCIKYMNCNLLNLENKILLLEYFQSNRASYDTQFFASLFSFRRIIFEKLFVLYKVYDIVIFCEKFMTHNSA